MLASLGCGNPTALAQLNPGETVLDLGSGGGIDVLLSARRVGPTGKAYGLDMTDEMLALARENQRKAGVENVEFLKGEIEHIPLPDNSVDVVISQLRDQPLRRQRPRVARSVPRLETGRPLRRIRCGDTRERCRPTCGKTCCCGSAASPGACRITEYVAKLAKAGFDDIDIEPTRVYNIEDARTFLSGQGVDVDAIAPQVEGKFMSAFIRRHEARKLLRSRLLRMTAEAVGTALLLAAATFLFRWLVPSLPKDAASAVVSHSAQTETTYL